MLAHMQKLMINTEDSVAGKALGINKLIVEKKNNSSLVGKEIRLFRGG